MKGTTATTIDLHAELHAALEKDWDGRMVSYVVDVILSMKWKACKSAQAVCISAGKLSIRRKGLVVFLILSFYLSVCLSLFLSVCFCLSVSVGF